MPITFFIISGYLVLWESENRSKRIARAIKRCSIAFGVLAVVYFAINFFYYRALGVNILSAFLSKRFWFNFLVMNVWQFEIVEVGDEVSAVSIGSDADKFNGVIILKNESTRFMFEKLQEGITLPELIKACMDKYDDSPVEEVGPQVLKFLDMLKEKGLLMADTQHGIKIED